MAAPTIDEAAIFPDLISRGAVGGPVFSTVVVISASGSEQRIAQRSQGLYTWDVSGTKTAALARDLIAFFHARQGKARGFRFKDWSDYSTTNEPVVSAGGPTLQLIKTYTSGGISRVRTIYKPMVTPATTLRRNGGAFTTFTLDTATGIVTLAAQTGPFTITNISNGVNGVVTCSAPPTGFGTTMRVWITGVVGMTGINDQLHELAGGVTGNTFPILTNTTSAGTYGSGGTVAHYWLTGNPNLPDAFDWAGSFHLPMRFGSDELRITHQDVDYFDFDSTELVELKG